MNSSYKIYTNVYGMLLWQFAFLTSNEKVKYWIASDRQRYRDFLYISLFQKHGLYKCKMKNKKSFEFYKGTQLLFWSSTFDVYKQLDNEIPKEETDTE